MQYGQRVIQRGMNGEDVEELQIRLAGFRGTIPDGSFGPGTELQVMQFQRDVMKMATPTGIVDRATMATLDQFAQRYPIDFAALRCPCGKCHDFGQGRFKDSYQVGKPKNEQSHRYEYPGIHRMLLWAVRAIFWYTPNYKYTITSGYRCEEDNKIRGRISTNHRGKAIDIAVIGKSGDDYRTTMIRCEKIRGIMVEKSNAQIGWNAKNRKAFEPQNIAPIWIHYDVRCYESRYLDDRFFCTTLEELDLKLPIEV